MMDRDKTKLSNIPAKGQESIIADNLSNDGSNYGITCIIQNQEDFRVRLPSLQKL